MRPLCVMELNQISLYVWQLKNYILQTCISGGQLDFMPVYVVTISKNLFLYLQISTDNHMNAGVIRNLHGE